MTHRGRGLLVAGLRQDPDVHALIHVLNAALGNVGHTVSYVPFELPPFGLVDELVSDLNGGRVSTLVVLGGNPAYDAPADLNFGAAMARAGERIHLGLHDDATGQASTWHLPAAHYLESWGRRAGLGRFAAGGAAADQSAVRGPHRGRAVVGAGRRHAADRSSDHPRHVSSPRRAGKAPAPAPEADPAFEKRWRAFLHDGFLAGSTQAGTALALRRRGADGAVDRRARCQRRKPGDDVPAGPVGVRRSLRRQRLAAGNARLHDQADLGQCGHRESGHAKELGVVHGDLVELQYKGRSLEAAVYVLPGPGAALGDAERWVTAATTPAASGRTPASTPTSCAPGTGCTAATA